MTDAPRRLGVRSSVVGFVAMSGLVVVASLGLLVLIDPRTQAYWTSRLAELAAAVRALVGR